MSYADRIVTLSELADRERAAFDPPTEPPAEDRAMRYLREGAGPAVVIYLEAHTGGDHHRFDPERLDQLTDALNAFLGLYTAAYGVDYDPDHTVREAAELLLETESIRDVAVVLTGVPASARPGEDTAPSEA